jgi:hypothetical protein
LIEIPLEDFWEWMVNYHAPKLKGMETAYGVPKVNKGNQTIEITFAASDDGDPKSWVTPPKCMAEWDGIK